MADGVGEDWCAVPCAVAVVAADCGVPHADKPTAIASVMAPAKGRRTGSTFRALLGETA